MVVDVEVPTLACALARGAVAWWHCTTHAGLDAVIELSDPPCRLTLAELYADVLAPPAGA